MNTTVIESYPDFSYVSPLTEVPYLKVYKWELIEINRHRQWMGDNWKISLYASFFYFVFIFVGGLWMRNRKPFKLRKALTVWNILLATFSLLGFIRTAPELFYTIQENEGWHMSVCSRQGHNQATAFWALLMVWSKLVELGDTVFIILKKQPLIFLHWYHHITVLCYVWSTFSAYEPSLRYFMSMNFAVHALMYSYYAFKVLGIKVPRNIAMIITCCQMSQMVVGVTINIYLLWVKSKGHAKCDDAGLEGIRLALCMYGSYFILFANFFYRSYFGKTKKE